MILTEQQRLPVWHGWVNFLYRRALAEPVPTEAVLAQMREALAEIDATGTRNNLTFHLTLLAEVHGRLGQGARGLGVIDEALAQVEASDERWWEAEIYRVRGDLLLSLSTADAAGAEACFERAMRIARRQRAKSLQLRAAASLARLWLDRGRRSAARDLLAPVYAWFTEGFDTPDLQQAKELLETLG